MKINYKEPKVILGLVLGLLAISAISIYAALNVQNHQAPVVKTLEIKEGTGTRAIAQTLANEKLINSSALFVFYVKVRGFVLEAGTYEISTEQSLVQVAELLRHGKNDVKITFIEGLRVEEYADILQKKLGINRADFKSVVDAGNLEGTLFPDTYYFKKGVSAQEVIKVLTNNFQEKTKELISANTAGLTPFEILILASIVEREESNSAERPKIAGILLNRYKNGELLGADATVQYIAGKEGNWWPKDLTEVNLASESPYNTRKFAGLPPKPICNPGLDAIKAVLKYEKSDARYYLHGKDGKVHYAKTLDEHLRNQSLYL